MTKAIRVENADTSDHKVMVQVWEKGPDGGHAKMISEHPLNYPTSMIEKTIWQGHFLVIKEVTP
jgi:hypothetical protein